MSKPLECVACGAGLSSAAIDYELGILPCDRCGTIYDLRQRRLEDAIVERPTVALEPRAPVPLPAGFEVDRYGDTLQVRWRWFRPSHVFLLCFTAVWNGFLVLWYALALGMAAEGGSVALSLLVFPLIHVAIGVGLTYYVAAGLLNRTVVTASTDGELSIRHQPLPWYPQPTLAAETLDQLYVTPRVRSNRRDVQTTWNLVAVRTDHTQVPLLSGFDELQQALWLEQDLESILGLRDRRVPGEASDARD